VRPVQLADGRGGYRAGALSGNSRRAEPEHLGGTDVGPGNALATSRSIGADGAYTRRPLERTARVALIEQARFVSASMLGGGFGARLSVEQTKLHAATLTLATLDVQPGDIGSPTTSVESVRPSHRSRLVWQGARMQRRRCRRG